MLNHPWDCIIVGAGAAGLYCGIVAGRRGRRVLIIDHSSKIAEKIRISGGGRCNFTNKDLSPSHPERHFISDNPHFCKSALARYTPQDFIREMDHYGLTYHEKHKGQLFCDQGSGAIIDLLLDAFQETGGQILHPVSTQSIRATTPGFSVDTDRGVFHANALVLATGGLSIPQIGATDLGYRIARQFGHRIIDPRPALVPLKFEPEAWRPFARLAGLALPVHLKTGEGKRSTGFTEDLLFTHRGLSGPAILQISSYWNPNTPLSIDLCPEEDLEKELIDGKRLGGITLGSALQHRLPSRLAKTWVELQSWSGSMMLQDHKDTDLKAVARTLNAWTLVPTGTEGFKKAEVTRGGVDTRELSSKTMESERAAGLYFIGELVDVTGWLGGYNFQWAWASAHAAGSAL